MAKGPIPMPTHLRILNGDRKDRINVNEPKARDGDLICPPDVADEVREIWEYTVHHAKAMGIEKPLDRDALLCYCEAVATHREASRIIAREGITARGERGGTIRHPAVSIQLAAATTIRHLAHEFGFTPSGRSGIRVGEANKPVEQGASRLLTG
ncbi:MAG TPA: phage terminase small subunit P27 family [Candidatus Binatia bacterium]|nr:phage terminase small subunit P27 family [Candidatus Binatia bacterium]